MEILAILNNCLWGGLFSAAMAILLTAPRNYLIATFFCGFSGRLVRDFLLGWGAAPNWSVMLAAAIVVLIATAIIPRRQAPPVVLVCGVLPLGAAVAVFNTIFELMKLSTAKGDALNAASMAFTFNLAKVFVTTLAIAVGIGAGSTITRLFRREDPVVA